MRAVFYFSPQLDQSFCFGALVHDARKFYRTQLFRKVGESLSRHRVRPQIYDAELPELRASSVAVSQFVVVVASSFSVKTTARCSFYFCLAVFCVQIFIPGVVMHT
jgi:hypothetical protein